MPKTKTVPSLDSSHPSWVVENEALECHLEEASDPFELLMRRHHHRMLQVTRRILRDEAEAEDAVQDAWLAAFTHLRDFEGRALLSTWLTRIATRSAIARAGKQRTLQSLHEFECVEVESETAGPGDDIDRKELAHLLEVAVDSLPVSYRLVVKLRDFKRLSTTETAMVLDISEENIRVRLHRARAALKKCIVDELRTTYSG